MAENKNTFIIAPSVDRSDLFFCFRGNGTEVKIDTRNGFAKSSHKLTTQENEFIYQNIL